MADFHIVTSEAGYGPVLIPTGPWTSKHSQLVRDKHVNGVRLTNARGWSDSDVSFLAEFPHLSSVEIYANEVRDISCISSISELRFLGLECNLRTPVALEKLSKLRTAKMSWKPALESILQCLTLQELNIQNWPHEDFSPLAKLTRIQWLQITSRRLTALNGIEALPEIQRVDLYSCPGLTNIDAIGACLHVWQLMLTSCKRINALDPIGALTHLRELHLDDNGTILTLLPLLKCLDLELLSFTGTTTIQDGRVKILKQLRALRTLRFAPRRHYDCDRKTILSAATDSQER